MKFRKTNNRIETTNLVLSAAQIRDWDAYTIKNEPIASIDLMERAAKQLLNWISGHYSLDTKIVVFAGCGNNGGDALALARLLYEKGYQNVTIELMHIQDSLSADAAINLERAKELNLKINTLREGDKLPQITNDTLFIDAIFGTGLSRPVTGYWAQIIEQINNQAAFIIAIDIPSGLMFDNNLNNTGAVIKATHTLTFQIPKIVFLFAENQEYIGELSVLDIGLHPGFLSELHAEFAFIDKNFVRRFIKKRGTFDHKGTFGHAFLIAGSYQKMGAAVLAAKACMRSGVGLLTVHVPESGRIILQTAVPEAMVCIDETEMNFCGSENLKSYEAIGIGPGVGKKKSMQNVLFQILEKASQPMVIDADALNILSENRDWLELLPENTILTPHPGEFDRLTKKHNSGYERFLTQLEFSKTHSVILVLKGAFTSISMPDGKCYFNTKGNPGMATAGSGDVLTGIILSLLAQGYTPMQAACIGVYVHAYAGDLAIKTESMESLIASDIIKRLGKAFNKINKKLNQW